MQKLSCGEDAGITCRYARTSILPGSVWEFAIAESPYCRQPRHPLSTNGDHFCHFPRACIISVGWGEKRGADAPHWRARGRASASRGLLDDGDTMADRSQPLGGCPPPPLTGFKTVTKNKRRFPSGPPSTTTGGPPHHVLGLCFSNMFRVSFVIVRFRPPPRTTLYVL